MDVVIALVIAGCCAGYSAHSFAIGVGVSAGLYAIMPYRFRGR